MDSLYDIFYKALCRLRSSKAPGYNTFYYGFVWKHTYILPISGLEKFEAEYMMNF